MSGTNPFRRKDNTEASQPQHAAGADILDQAALRFPPIDTGTVIHTHIHRWYMADQVDGANQLIDIPKATTKGKTVRIISPHYLRAKEGYGISTITSPPPRDSVGFPPTDTDSASSGEPSPVDPFSPQSDEGTSQDDDEDLRRNTMANASTGTPQSPPNLNMPVNHARKAPALQFGADASTFESRAQADPSALVAMGSRPHYDVDDFKRLLLTGEKIRTDKNTSATTPPAHGQGLQLGDSNSNTDASSVSRQSIFEPHPEAHPESPSTSMDIPLSDDERHGLVQSSPNAGRSRPSVPPSRHGKLVKQNAPQTVAFESLSSSPPDLSLQSTSSMQPFLLVTSGSSRDLDKPLPLPPRTESPSPMETRSDTSLGGPEAPNESLTPPNHPSRVTSKRNPPALPAARRHGQGRSRSSTNDSSGSTSISEGLSQYTHPSLTNSSSTTSSKPPPLPPPRRAGTNPAQENTTPGSSAAPTTDLMQLPAFKPRPPAPLSRTPSTTSIKRVSRISPNSGSPAPAPPPPPRRRGSSQSQSSFTPSRLSGEYRISSNEHTRSGSGASTTQQPSVPETQTEGKDIMADLTALQKEVDELRGKFGR